MYEEQTYEEILRRCLARVPGDLDKREGSVIYDALAPVCCELAAVYTELSCLLDRAFPDTATGGDLDRLAATRSITRKGATCALRQGILSGVEVPVGARMSGGGTVFQVTEVAEGGYVLTAETAGVAGNGWFGTLLPIDHLPGLREATLGAVLIPGEDEEGDESLRARYFASYDSQSYGGNVADYQQRIGDMDGVGGVKVHRAPQGGGTVGVTIVGSDWAVPSQALVQAVQQAVDPVDASGEGVGFAPIGHRVTVAPVTGRVVDVAMQITLDPTVTWENVAGDVRGAVQGYLQELARSWAGSAALTVRVSHIETRVLEVAGVLDVGGTTLNGGAGNLLLGPLEIPVLGGVTDGAA